MVCKYQSLWGMKNKRWPKSFITHTLFYSWIPCVGFCFLVPPHPLPSPSPSPIHESSVNQSISPESLTQQAFAGRVHTDTHTDTYMTSKYKCISSRITDETLPGTLSTYHSPLCKRMLLFPASSSATLQSTQHYYYYYYYHWQIHDFCISQ